MGAGVESEPTPRPPPQDERGAGNVRVAVAGDELDIAADRQVPQGAVRRRFDDNVLVAAIDHLRLCL